MGAGADCAINFFFLVATLFPPHPLSKQKGGELHCGKIYTKGIKPNCWPTAHAEDLVQETFIKALIHASTVTDLSPSQQRAWLYRTFKNLFFDRCRRAVLEQEYLHSVQLPLWEPSGIPEVEQDRTIFQLRYFDGYTAQEIAQMLNIPPGTVRSKLSRCRNYLKQQLQP